MIYTVRYASPVGQLILAEEDGRITGLWMAGQRYFARTLPAEGVREGTTPVLAQATAWLDAYFAGERPDPAALPLSPGGTVYQRAVWDILLRIPYGSCTTYGEIARALPGTSPRAVGGAVGRNPISVIIPCHRVIGAGDRLTGYAGGLTAKAWLLQHEGYRPRKK